jgi:hypothetical protein
MPTNFPTSVDNFTNPTANDSLNLPSHSTQHANANDAIEAIETSLLAGGINYVGLVHVGTTSFTSSSAVNVNNIFNSNFSNYRILITANTGAGLRMRMRVGGTDATSGYGGAAPTYYSFSGFDGIQRISNGSYWDLWTLTSNVDISIDLHSPNLTQRTSFLGQSVSDYGSGNVYIGNGGGQINDNTAYTGFTVYPSSSTVSGNIRVYGYRNS